MQSDASQGIFIEHDLPHTAVYLQPKNVNGGRFVPFPPHAWGRWRVVDRGPIIKGAKVAPDASGYRG